MEWQDVQSLDDFWAWREQERSKMRYMTAEEYFAWSRVGDVISCPSSATAFPGGITIDLGAPPVIGRTQPLPNPPQETP